MNPIKRAITAPLDAGRALLAALDQSKSIKAEIEGHGPEEFERALPLLESLVSRFKGAFLAQSHQEADAALAYHARANEELSEFVPLYYRRAVLENVVDRYERTAFQMRMSFM